jgi:hypothetical protein
VENLIEGFTGRLDGGVLYIGRGNKVTGRVRKSSGRRWVFNTGCFETEKEREGDARAPLDEGNGGGTGGASLPLPPSTGGIPWWRMARRRRPGRRRLGRCPRKVTSLGGPIWAESVKRSGPVAKISKETTWAIKVNRAELTMGCGKFFSQFSNKIWVLKLRISNFKPKLNWGQTRINSNKLFEYFSNLQLLKIRFE